MPLPPVGSVAVFRSNAQGFVASLTSHL